MTLGSPALRPGEKQDKNKIGPKGKPLSLGPSQSKEAQSTPRRRAVPVTRTPGQWHYRRPAAQKETVEKTSQKAAGSNEGQST